MKVHTYMLPDPTFTWADMKTDKNGLVPVIVQDEKTMEVRMLAYMNEESFNMTIQTGRMTYFSRSRHELWVKGLTSGNIQYVKSLVADCDKDTILATVYQEGDISCHTGSRTCFFNTITSLPEDESAKNKAAKSPWSEK